MSEKTFFFNGIDGVTGRYLLPPMTAAEVKALAKREKPDLTLLKRLKKWVKRHTVDEKDRKRKPIFDGNPKDLAATGWGVIFAPNVSQRVRSELSLLLDHRRDQATRNGNQIYFQKFEYRSGETAQEFLLRSGVRPDAAADPDRRVPYYLLLVGDPEALPYRFQFELGVNYAVGRIHFDRPEDYRNYARSVIAAGSRTRLARQVTFFGVENENDPATQRTSAELIRPLAAGLLEPGMTWKVDQFSGSQASRAQLGRLLGGDKTPALLFTASHGVGFPVEDDRQITRQGGLICQDWLGPNDGKGVLRDHYFTAEDLSDAASVQGLIAFLFACYSAGTPDRDSYYDEESLGNSRRIAQRPFVSRLCQRLLSHPNGGALAVVGHVDRAWSTSFAGSDQGEGVDNYRNCLRRLLNGHTVGWSMEYFNQAHATLSTKLSNLWEDRHQAQDVDLEGFADLWLTNNDARNFVIFGDPAVKLAGF